MIPPLVSLLVFIFLGLGLLFTIFRLLMGPTLSDRVVALDLLGFVVLGFIGANILQSGQTVYLDVLTVAAIVLFFGTIAFARYLERRSK
jgi:multicomponent Na+:H+ antiporter subunit F